MKKLVTPKTSWTSAMKDGFQIMTRENFLMTLGPTVIIATNHKYEIYSAKDINDLNGKKVWILEYINNTIGQKVTENLNPKLEVRYTTIMSHAQKISSLWLTQKQEIYSCLLVLAQTRYEF